MEKLRSVYLTEDKSSRVEDDQKTITRNSNCPASGCKSPSFHIATMNCQDPHQIPSPPTCSAERPRIRPVMQNPMRAHKSCLSKAITIALLMLSTSHLIQIRPSSCHADQESKLIQDPSSVSNTTSNQEAQLQPNAAATSTTSASKIIEQKMITSQSNSTQENQEKNKFQSSIEINASSQSQQVKSAPVLRPSIEEVASELSKKYLNLENGNWRVKHSPSSPQLAVQQQVSQPPNQRPLQGSSATTTNGTVAVNATLAKALVPDLAIEDDISVIIGAERDIQHQQVSSSSPSTNGGGDSVMANEGKSSAESSSPSLLLTSQREENSFRDITDRLRDHYLNIDTVAAAAAATAMSNQPRNHKQPVNASTTMTVQTSNGSRKRKANATPQAADNELVQCHQYLRRQHSSNQQTSSSASIFEAPARLASDQQQVPCSCESRESIDLDANLTLKGLAQTTSSTWLSCDYVQLIGSHLFSPSSSSSATGASETRSGEQGELFSLVTKFSQRDSGLQTLPAQMFHYLQLNHLKALDLSGNRIRNIKMDAFHGIETKLEYLNLAQNLLGDSRATYSETLANGRLIFNTDELNRLKNLKWLSLNSNQINQLAANIFVKQTSQQQQQQQQQQQVSSQAVSKLRYLDLSDNLLKFTPTDSIRLLDSLEHLDLSRNRIVHLDQNSKFPKNLRYLDLSENLISSVRQCDLIDLNHLIELNLSRNQIRQLDQMAFVSSVPATSVVATAADANSNSNPSAGRSKRNADADSDDNILGDATGESSDSSRLEDNGDDLMASESRQSRKYQQNNQQTSFGDEDQQLMPQLPPQFNATLRLNLSYNFLENVPGDSLLKFPHLQQLDLSFNRIRRLDANYLCSIYNLVESLQHLDLSGNLLTLPDGHSRDQQASGNEQTNATHQQVDSGIAGRQLNKLFGCLQKLEKLLLSTNRFGVLERSSNEHKQPLDASSGLEVEASGEDANGRQDEDQDDLSGAESFNAPVERLLVRFGDGLGSKYLKSLDLSDNQLHLMPIIELNAGSQPTQAASQQQSLQSVNSSNASQLNLWMMNSRIYLEELNLNFNYIERLDEHEFEFLFNLIKLCLDFNKISSLPVKVMRRFSNLEHLSLNGNRISSLEPLNELLARSSKTLRYLNLANNRLVDWPLMSPSPARSFASNQHESSLSSAPMEFKQYDDEGTKDERQLMFQNLEELNLDGNSLTSANVTALFDQLVHMRSLRTLNLSHNLLNKVKSEWFKYANTNLRRLLLSGNKINNIDLGAFAMNQVNELLQLSLDHNLLKELKRKTFDSLPKLRELNLASNMIHTINSETFNQINALQILRLDHNKLTSWKCEYFSNLCNSLSGNINADIQTLLSSSTGQVQAKSPLVSSLVELDLSHNSISQLRVNSISVHTKLRSLNLEHNKLSFIPHDLFRATIFGGGSSFGRQIQLVSSLKYLNLGHNRIQTIDNINFKPLRNLYALDLSFNELQTLGVDVVLGMDTKSLQREQANRHIVVSSNLTNLLMDDEVQLNSGLSNKTSDRQPRDLRPEGQPSTGATIGIHNWPSLCKLRHLNVANNQLTLVNQSIISELSPFAQLNLNLSHNLLDSDSLPVGFYSKIMAQSPVAQSSPKGPPSAQNSHQSQQGSASETKQQQPSKYDLIFTLKLESLDLSHNKLNQVPADLLENHYTSMESCNLSHNRIQNLIANSNMMIQIKSLDLEFNPLSRESNELILFEQRNARVLNLAATRIYAIHLATQAMGGTGAQDLLSVGSQMKHRLANQTSQLDLIRSISRQIDAPYLRHLNLSSNQLVWLAANVFDRMHSLQVLDLSNNQLTRLHLLNNQLAHVSSTLDYLNMGFNLFTNIDLNDFSQLTRIRHLDLSNLLSLQKMNCRFLSKLTTLKTLRMFNYPLMRQNLNQQLAALLRNPQYSERMKRKLRLELIMSTIGKHCFTEETTQIVGEAPNQVSSQALAASVKWFDLKELELEFFQNFNQIVANKQQVGSLSGAMRLTDELSQLIGPRTSKLTLYGLNVTSISDDTLLGITSDQLQLKISHTSSSQLPLRQILNSVAKRTKLHLDFRNNNIQSIDMGNLQWLDELQQTNQVFQHGDRSSLRLGSNPFRCDCQTRPLWLWLNQKWDNAAGEIPTTTSGLVPANGDEQSGSGGDQTAQGATGQQANHMQFKLNALSQTSDMKCYFPQKLRGKLVQHVYYNDLVCKGPSQSPQATVSQSRQSKKRGNDTRSSESSHYFSSVASHLSGDYNDAEDHMDDDDFLDLADGSRGQDSVVRLTRFNKYQPILANYSSYFLATSIQDSSGNSNLDHHLADDDNGKIAKRDHHSVGGDSSHRLDPGNDGFIMSAVEQTINTKYSKHRPNTHQKHSHFNTLSTLNQLLTHKTIGSRQSAGNGNGAKQSTFLTESDVMILTLTSGAMIVMSFLIMTICFVKYRMDQSDKEQILSGSHGKMLISNAFRPDLHQGKSILPESSPSTVSNGSGDRRVTGHSSSSSSSGSSSKKLAGSSAAGSSSAKLSKSTSGISHSSRSAKLIKKPQHYASQQVLVPIPHASLVGAPASQQNFLMRSPTIRRMHGLAANASDWFKFTLRAYPSSAASRRRRIFMGDNIAGSSQLTTSQLDKHYVRESKLVPASGCPIHAFSSVKRLQDQVPLDQAEQQCVYCSRLLNAIQQTKVHYVMPTSQASDLMSAHQKRAFDSTSDGRVTNSHVRVPMATIIGSGGTTIQDHELSDSNERQPPAEPKNGYYSPSLMKALAKQHDQEEQLATIGAYLRQKAQSQQQRHLMQQNASNGTSLGHSREQRVKSMRTFGFNAGPSSTNTITSTKTQQSESDSVHVLATASQIPTIDVDGRFAYQTESQLDTASHTPSRADNEDLTDGRGSEAMLSPSEEVFLLVREDSVASREPKRMQSMDGGELLAVAGTRGKAMRRHEDEHSKRLSGSVAETFDECSHSSSPVAYGFMRSSPSLTTVSSATLTQNHYTINRSPEGPGGVSRAQQSSSAAQVADRLPAARQGLSEKSSGHVATSCSRDFQEAGQSNVNSNNYSDNDDFGYVVNQKQTHNANLATVRATDQNNGSSTSPVEEQMIISRL